MRPGRTDKLDHISRHTRAAIECTDKATRFLVSALKDGELDNATALRPIIDLLTQGVAHRITAYVAQDRVARLATKQQTE